MQLWIQVFVEERQEFDSISNPGNKGYIRPAAAFREIPGSADPITSVGMSFLRDIHTKPTEATVEVSDELANAIARFVNNHMNKETGMDCYGFVNLYADKPSHAVCELEKHWSFRKIFSAEVSAGDVVAFCQPGIRFRHAAVCVSPDLYVSVFGVNGDLEFGSSEDIHSTYATSEIFILS